MLRVATDQLASEYNYIVPCTHICNPVLPENYIPDKRFNLTMHSNETPLLGFWIEKQTKNNNKNIVTGTIVN